MINSDQQGESSI